MSRIYSGIHFMSANRDGKVAGEKIAECVIQNFLLPNDSLPLVRIEGISTNMVGIRVLGNVGRTCILEATTDLVNWTRVSTNVAKPGGALVRDSLATRQFYRALQMNSE